MAIERTLLIIKPDGVVRGLVGETISRLERRGLKLVAMRLMQVSREAGERLYAVHRGKPFYESLIEYLTAAPVVVCAWEGPKAVAAVRQTIGGEPHPLQADPGSVRADFGLDIGRNLVHGSAPDENPEGELAIFFRPEDYARYRRAGEDWLAP